MTGFGHAGASVRGRPSDRRDTDDGCGEHSLILERTCRRERSTEAESRPARCEPPIQHSARLLTTLPGVSDLTAQVMVAEIGLEMARFPRAAHLIS